MYAEVISSHQLSPTMIRIVLGGGTLDQFEMIPAADAYINARFVPAGSPVSIPFEPEDLQTLRDEHRPRPRRYTVRHWDQQRTELTIDFVAHGDSGYAGSWAQQAKPGDRLQFSGPGGSYQPAADVAWHLLVGDESALGAIGAALQGLPENRRAMAFIVVDGPDHEIELPTVADAEIVWVHRSNSGDRDTADRDAQLADAVAESRFPAGAFDVFVHGEAAEVRAVRKHLISQRGIDLAAASISPYWRRKHTDEAWRQVKRQWLSEQASDVAVVAV